MYQLIFAEHFIKQCRALAGKYPHIREDFEKTLKLFQKESAQFLGAKLYKLRIASSDMKKGKRGGFRLIVFLVETASVLIPIAIYAKSEKSVLSEYELEYHLGKVILEFRKEGCLFFHK